MQDLQPRDGFLPSLRDGLRVMLPQFASLPKKLPGIVTVLFAIIGMLAVINWTLSIATKNPMITITGDNNQVVAREGTGFDVAAMCEDKATIVNYGIATELGAKEYVIQNGLDQVRWKSTPGNYAAVHYSIERGVQSSETVEMTKSAIDCALKKAH